VTVYSAMAQPENLRPFAGTAKELGAEIAGRPGALVVVDFWAKWCPPCVKLGELLPTLSSENPRVMFLKVDVDQNRELQTHYQVNSIPLLKFFKATADGSIAELASVIGADVPQIRAKLSQFG
jgi:thiol-disulfide isomerase/thioredoxin